MGQQFIELYIGSVCLENLAYRIPKENRLNVEAQLLKEGRLDKFIIIDPEEVEVAKKQQELIRQKLAELAKAKEAEQNPPTPAPKQPAKNTRAKTNTQP